CFDPRERLERLRTASSTMLKIEAPEERADVFADWTLWRASDLVFSKIAFSPLRFERDPKLPGHDQALLLLEIYASGIGHGEIEGHPTWIGPDHIHLADLTRRYRKHTTAAVVYGAVIPHDAVGYDPGSHPAYVSMSAATPVGRFLINAFQAILARLPTALAEDAETLAEGLSAVIRALLLANNREVDRRVLRGALALTVRAHIDANLHDPGLSTATLCETFGMSRATLYRMLEEVGGIDAYVRAKRLEHCRHALRLAPPEHGGVKRIARHWGFVDTDRFHRLYKARFGHTPGDDLNHVAPKEPRHRLVPASDEDVVRVFEGMLRKP
ncbi:MAG: helix-turn-helix domain-containing protein, partial [Pseudomonadota bacterium]